MTEEEIATSKAYGFDKKLTIEDIAWDEAYKYTLKGDVRRDDVGGAFYEGFIAGFTYKFKGEVK